MHAERCHEKRFASAVVATVCLQGPHFGRWEKVATRTHAHTSSAFNLHSSLVYTFQFIKTSTSY